MPDLIVTGPDKPRGRGLKLSETEVKKWAIENSVPVLQPENLEDESFKKEIAKEWDMFVVVSYGKIMPKWLLDIPKYGSINVHFSLLPKYRGATPVESAILAGEPETGISIIIMDEKVDHGPVIAMEKISIAKPLPTSFELVEKLSVIGGRLLAKTIPQFFHGQISPKEQEHGKATYSRKISKMDALINLEDDPLINWRKIQAYHESPRPFFFTQKKGKKTRVIIRSAECKDGKLEILKVIPEGKKEISYKDFLRSQSAEDHQSSAD